VVAVEGGLLRVDLDHDRLEGGELGAVQMPAHEHDELVDSKAIMFDAKALIAHRSVCVDDAGLVAKPLQGLVETPWTVRADDADLGGHGGHWWPSSWGWATLTMSANICSASAALSLASSTGSSTASSLWKWSRRMALSP